MSDYRRKDFGRILDDVANDFFGKDSKFPANYTQELEKMKRKTKKNDPEDTLAQLDSLMKDLRKNINDDLMDSTAEIQGLSGKKPAQKPAEGKKEEKTPVEAAKEEAAPEMQEKPQEPEKDPMEELKELIGLKAIKEDVEELITLMKMQKLRQEKGMKTVPVSKHLVFSGNPGTGKTTVARLLARLYKQEGILSKGQLVEVDRSMIVAGYVGQTAIKTQEKIQEALGGVLFIDEAYTLVNGGPNDFGQEAIDTVLKAMEDHRDDFVVIVAGYTDLMKKFINSNPGLKSRFNKYFYFEDYNAEELLAIFHMNCKKYQYHLEEAAEAKVKAYFEKLVDEKEDNFANARDVRNYFETIITNQARRIAKLENPTEDDLALIVVKDLSDEEETPEENPEEKEAEEKEAEEKVTEEKEVQD